MQARDNRRMASTIRRSPRQRFNSAVAAMACGVAALLACSPALNWRDVRPEGAGLSAQLPCKGSTYARTMSLAGAPVAWQLVACSAAGQTWALGYAQLGDPGAASAALRALRDGAQVNLAAQLVATSAWAPPGATPNDLAARTRLQGKLPDGRAVVEELAVFTRGLWVYQASVLGADIAPEAAEQFFASLRLL
jgi:hypothetical protein